MSHLRRHIAKSDEEYDEQTVHRTQTGKVKEKSCIPVLHTSYYVLYVSILFTNTENFTSVSFVSSSQ